MQIESTKSSQIWHWLEKRYTENPTFKSADIKKSFSKEYYASIANTLNFAKNKGMISVAQRVSTTVGKNLQRDTYIYTINTPVIPVTIPVRYKKIKKPKIVTKPETKDVSITSILSTENLIKELRSRYIEGKLEWTADYVAFSYTGK